MAGYHQSTGGMNVASNVASILHSRSRAKAAAGPSGVAVGIDFPLVCEICLGDNPYVRMIKMPNGAECKISKRPYTMFKWRAGRGGRYKTTIICYEVAQAKNVCQACLSDMEYGLPVAVRDKVLSQALADAGEGGAEALAIPESEVGQSYYFNQIAAQQHQDAAAGRIVPYGQHDAGSSAYGRAASTKLLKLARRIHQQPYGAGGPGRGGGGAPARPGGSAAGRSARSGTAFRNLPKMCSFWVAGTCMRVGMGNCPFRPCCGVFKFPELAGSNRELNKSLIASLNEEGAAAVMKSMSAETRAAIKDSQKGSKIDSIRARYYGVDDKLASKYLGRMGGGGGGSVRPLEPPVDSTIATVWVGGCGENVVTEGDLRQKFHSFGGLGSVRMVQSAGCAFVEFDSQSSAIAALNALRGSCVVKGRNLSLSWAKKRSKGKEGGGGAAAPPPLASSLPIPGAAANGARPAVPAAFLAGVASVGPAPPPGAAGAAAPAAAAAAAGPALPPMQQLPPPPPRAAIRPMAYPSMNPNYGRR